MKANKAPDQNETLSIALLRINFLEDALKRIAAINDQMNGGDWEEIEHARQVASDALIGVVTPEDRSDFESESYL